MPYLAIVLVCGAGIAAADCDRTTALDVTVAPARTPVECLKGGEATGAKSLVVPPGGVIRITCERRKG